MMRQDDPAEEADEVTGDRGDGDGEPELRERDQHLQTSGGSVPRIYRPALSAPTGLVGARHPVGTDLLDPAGGEDRLPVGNDGGAGGLLDLGPAVAGDLFHPRLRLDGDR